MTYVETPINVRAWFDVSRLSISPELIAAKHQFQFNRCQAVELLEDEGLLERQQGAWMT